MVHRFESYTLRHFLCLNGCFILCTHLTNNMPRTTIFLVMHKKNKKFLRLLAMGSIGFSIGVIWSIFGGAAQPNNGEESRINNPDSVKVTFKKLDGISGCYVPKEDIIFIRDSSDYHISHELKHAHNAIVFPCGIDVCANELSAYCALVLNEVEVYSGVYADSSKYNWSTKRPAMLPRDVNYYIPILNLEIPDINQKIADYVLKLTMEYWADFKDLYIKDRVCSFCMYGFQTISDAELEKLFTFKINNEYCSLFKMCSPWVRKRLRDECNGNSLTYLLQRPFQSER